MANIPLTRRIRGPSLKPVALPLLELVPDLPRTDDVLVYVVAEQAVAGDVASVSGLVALAAPVDPADLQDAEVVRVVVDGLGVVVGFVGGDAGPSVQLVVGYSCLAQVIYEVAFRVDFCLTVNDHRSET